MLRFTVQGRIGRIDQVKSSPTILRLSVAADRRVDGRPDDPLSAWTKTEWLSVVCFSEPLNQTILAELEVGASVTLEGRIEPRRRQVGEVAVTDHSFILTAVQRLTLPAAGSARAGAAPDRIPASA
jgi:single-stranded DNA-binding protein